MRGGCQFGGWNQVTTVGYTTLWPPFTFTSVRGVVTKLRWHARAVGARALAIIRDNLHSRFQILIRSLQLCSIFGNILLPVMSF